MFKVALAADIHIKTDELPVEASWNHNRLMLLAESISNMDVDELWIIGDLFDKARPTIGDIISAKLFVSIVGKPIKFLEGNHERINRDVYTLNMLKGVLGITKLPEKVSIEGVGITAIGHDFIHKIKEMPKDDILLSHFRWSHAIFGKGELLKRDEKYIKNNFTSTILGDIHYPYQPEANVKYISSPYSINFGTPKEYGLMVLELNKGKHTETRVALDLPCKITYKTKLSLVNGLIESTDLKHQYNIIVSIRFNELEKFKKLKSPSNIELIPKYEEIKNENNEVTKIKIGNNIKDVLLDSLELPQKEDKEYIKNILKEI